MTYNFDDEQEYVENLVRGVKNDAGIVDNDLKEELRLLYDSKLFFIRSGRPLNRKGSRLSKIIQNENLIPDSERPSIIDWQDVGKYRPITLRAAMRMRHALERITKSGCATAIDCISIAAKTPLQFEKNDIIPSIFHVDKKELRKVRDALGLKRHELSRRVFQKDNTIGYLEDGENGRDFRITEQAARSLHNTLGMFQTEKSMNGVLILFDVIFGYQYARSYNSLALTRDRGNIFALR
jgi:hypothetical protein